MKILSRMKYRALSTKNGWPKYSISGHVSNQTMALLFRDAVVAPRPRTVDNQDKEPHSWSDNCNELSRLAPTEGNVKVLTREKCLVLAERNGWSTERAKGYVDGETCRSRGKKPSKYVLIGIDEYSLGFRAGYFERQCETPGGESVARLANST